MVTYHDEFTDRQSPIDMMTQKRHNLWLQYLRSFIKNGDIELFDSKQMARRSHSTDSRYNNIGDIYHLMNRLTSYIIAYHIMYEM